jgi:predicted peptidase
LGNTSKTLQEKLQKPWVGFSQDVVPVLKEYVEVIRPVEEVISGIRVIDALVIEMVTSLFIFIQRMKTCYNDSWTQTYKNHELYEWLLLQRKVADPKE